MGNGGESIPSSLLAQRRCVSLVCMGPSYGAPLAPSDHSHVTSHCKSSRSQQQYQQNKGRAKTKQSYDLSTYSPRRKRTMQKKNRGTNEQQKKSRGTSSIGTCALPLLLLLPCRCAAFHKPQRQLPALLLTSPNLRPDHDPILLPNDELFDRFDSVRAQHGHREHFDLYICEAVADAHFRTGRERPQPVRGGRR